MINKTRAWFADQANRAYVYRVLVALGAVALLYGLLSKEEVATWLGVAAQVLSVGGNGLAAVNTTTHKENQ